MAAATFCIVVGLMAGPGLQVNRLMKATPAVLALIVAMAGLFSFFGYAVGAIIEDALRVF
jgi:hypothetical protein